MKQSELFPYFLFPLVPMKALPQIGCRIMSSFWYTMQMLNGNPIFFRKEVHVILTSS